MSNLITSPGVFLDVSLTNDIPNITGDFTLSPILFDTQSTAISCSYNSSTGYFITQMQGIYLFSFIVTVYNIVGGCNGLVLNFTGTFSSIQVTLASLLTCKAPDNTYTFSGFVIKEMANIGDYARLECAVNNGSKVAGFKGSAACRLRVIKLN